MEREEAAWNQLRVRSRFRRAVAVRKEQRARVPLLPVEAFLTAAACAHPGLTNVHWPLAKHW